MKIISITHLGSGDLLYARPGVVFQPRAPSELVDLDKVFRTKILGMRSVGTVQRTHEQTQGY